MALTSGARLGPYEITALLGVGGMGEVYRATDTNLKRAVAIKVLPASVATDPERLARFQREAEVLAALNHPHIAQIYGLEKADGVTALVLELVEGPTLADRIAQGAIPTDEALPIAKQIAEALEAAHEQGIIHRDLKPANIKVRPDGTVKVLDFGLAKAEKAPFASEAPALTSPTITSPALLTGAGVLLGTAAYMSPEQAKGRSAERRSDVWAFGCVLFEMLTGRRPFGGDDVSATIVSILRDEPDWSRLPVGIPTAIRALLHQCLLKDPAKRLPHIGPSVLQLVETLAAEARTQGPPPTRSLSRRIERAVVAFALVALVGALVFVGRSANAPTKPGEMVLFHVEPLPDETFPGAGGAPRFSVSPDGRMIVYASSAQGRVEQLRIRRLDSSETPPLRGSEGPFRSGESVQMPFWSPDSRTVAFFDAMAGKLKRIELAGGKAESVCDVSAQNPGGTWSSAGVILFSTVDTRGIQRVSATGGTPDRVTALDDARHELTHLWPQFLPDGRHFLFHVVSSDETIPAAVFVGELGSASRVHLVDTPSMAVLAPPDRLLFVRGEALVAQTLDLSSLTLTGEPSVIVATIRRAPNGRIPVSASSTGVLAYTEAGTTEPYQATWRGRDGRELRNRSRLAISDQYMRFSADGRRLAFARGSPPDIWILDLDRNVETRLTTDPAIETHPMWSPDGSKLVFRAQQGARRTAGLYEQAASGASPESLLLANEGGRTLFPLDLTADGRYILFTEGPYGATATLLRVASDLRMLDTSSDRKPYPLLTSDRWRGNAKLSPNGRWLAYTSDESGTLQVFVRSFPDPQRARYQVSNNGGFAPRWRRDGRELYYEDSQSRLVAVGVATEDRFDIQKSAPLFAMPLMGTVERYEVTPDGQQFIVAETSGGNPITIAVNWMNGLQ